VRPTPSYTLFITKPETVGRLGNRKAVSLNELRRSLARIAEEQKDWKIGFLPELQEATDAFGILLRTNEHQPISLRRLLVRSAFRSHPSTLAFAAGVTLEQRLIIFDLAESGNFLIAGTESSKQHLIHNLILTLISLNSPGELRLAIAGQSSQIYQPLINIPHALGRLLVKPDEGRRLFDGLCKELSRRQQSLESENVSNIAEYNASIKDEGKTSLPRIVVLVESLSDEDWQEARDSWIPSLTQILEDRGKSGIHLILSADRFEAPDVPSAFNALIPTKIITRGIANEYVERLTNFHGSLIRFIDAVAIESVNGNEEIIPIEVCNITEEEIHNTISYWHQAVKQRSSETQEEIAQVVSGRTGVTGILKTPPSLEPKMEPLSPVPVERELQTPDLPERKSTTGISPFILQRAQAVAAYLGWIGVGPLQDILGLSAPEAELAIAELKAMEIVENIEGPTPRFIRLINQPPDE
jgi:DNA segregation ATPase FtsK/SpoIIIE-like protein